MKDAVAPRNWFMMMMTLTWYIEEKTKYHIPTGLIGPEVRES